MLTTRIKIIIGFTIMVVLLAGLALLGYLNMAKSSRDFVTFDRYAAMNIAASDMGTAIARSISSSYAFSKSLDMKEMEEAEISLQTFEKLCDVALETTQIASRKEALSRLRDRGRSLRAAQTMLRDSFGELRKQYNTIVRPSYNLMIDLLSKIADSSNDHGAT